MPVPIEFHFEEEDLPVFRDVILVEGELSERSFTLGSEPDELIFNADHAVLSEWDETDFEDLIPE
jgi:hypothetical protein